MDDSVAYGIRKGRVSYDVMPGVNGELACYYSRTTAVAVFHDIKDVPPFSIRKGIDTPVVNNEEPHSLDLFEEFTVAPVRPRDP